MPPILNSILQPIKDPNAKLLKDFETFDLKS